MSSEESQLTTMQHAFIKSGIANYDNEIRKNRIKKSEEQKKLEQARLDAHKALKKGNQNMKKPGDKKSPAKVHQFSKQSR